jgi:hypothetical protein
MIEKSFGDDFIIYLVDDLPKTLTLDLVYRVIKCDGPLN